MIKVPSSIYTWADATGAGADMVRGVGHGAGGVDQVGHDDAIPAAADLGSWALI